jgi:hypothetical protein
MGSNERMSSIIFGQGIISCLGAGGHGAAGRQSAAPACRLPARPPACLPATAGEPGPECARATCCTPAVTISEPYRQSDALLAGRRCPPAGIMCVATRSFRLPTEAPVWGALLAGGFLVRAGAVLSWRCCSGCLSGCMPPQTPSEGNTPKIVPACLPARPPACPSRLTHMLAGLPVPAGAHRRAAARACGARSCHELPRVGGWVAGWLGGQPGGCAGEGVATLRVSCTAMWPRLRADHPCWLAAALRGDLGHCLLADHPCRLLTLSCVPCMRGPHVLQGHLGHSCRHYRLPRPSRATQVGGWGWGAACCGQDGGQERRSVRQRGLVPAGHDDSGSAALGLATATLMGQQPIPPLLAAPSSCLAHR